MSKSIQALREQRKAKATEARNLLDNNPGDKWTDDVQAKYDGLMADIDRVDAQIENHTKLMDIEASNRQRVDREQERSDVSADEAEHNVNNQKLVFASFLRGGVEAARNQIQELGIQNAMSTTTDSEGGYLAPDEFSAQLLEELKAFGGMRSVATVMQTSNGNLIEWPTVDATSQEGEIVGENAAVGNQEVSFGIKNIEAFKYSSKDIAVPFELLQDSQIDLEAYIRRLLAERIARITNRHFTDGTGTGQPMGAVGASAAGKVGQTGQTTTITYDDLVDLEHSIDPAYRQMGNIRYMFHDTTLKALKKMKDADNRPLWVPGVAVSEPDTINGYAYTINQHIPVMAANAKSVLFGDFSKYIIRDVMNVSLFRMTDSAYTKNGQVGFLAFSRHDGDLVDAAGNCIKHYQNSAT